jgi:hypothetical protein
MSGAVEGVALLPCPFCGNDDPLCYPVEEGSAIHQGGCGNADCILFDDLPGNFTSRDHFADWWNTRTTPPARSYADGVADCAAIVSAKWEAEDDASAFLALDAALAAIRLLSQGGKA